MLDELASEGQGSTSRDVERHCTSVLARFGNVRALEMRYGPAGTRVVASFDSWVDEETRDSIVAGSTVCLGGFYGDEQAEMRICSEDAPHMAPPSLVLSTNAPTNGGAAARAGVVMVEAGHQADVDEVPAVHRRPMAQVVVVRMATRMATGTRRHRCGGPVKSKNP